MWEYRRVEYKFKSKMDIDIELNKEGKEGWEIVDYQETKPERFGLEFSSIVLYKRLKK